MVEEKSRSLRKIDRILIANRGEIAIRIIRACREMGITSIVTYSDADADSLFVRLADEAINIGPANAAESYLNIEKIISAAIASNADAIHPGVGFLSENSEFDKAVTETGIKFIGPKYDVIDKLGDKSKAREIADAAGAPIVPGTEEPLKSVDEAITLAEEIGYPVMIKAVSGGGGRGIRIVNSKDEIASAFEHAQKEATVCFADDRLYMEKMVINAKHIEVQILADEHGNVVHLGERDCSVQRKNQKVTEEAPCIAITQDLRDRMGHAAISIAKEAGYQNSGTIEFLYTPYDGKFYFMEMNARIQVEHTVTEMVTGIDIVKEQIRIARGEELGYDQSDVVLRGHAIECRINAEDTANNFMPNCGTVDSFHMPSGFGVRFEGCIFDGFVVSPFYDSMIGKVIVLGKDRNEAIAKMHAALTEMTVSGVKTNIEFQQQILSQEKFVEGDFNTGFIKNVMNIG